MIVNIFISSMLPAQLELHTKTRAHSDGERTNQPKLSQPSNHFLISMITYFWEHLAQVHML